MDVRGCKLKRKQISPSRSVERGEAWEESKEETPPTPAGSYHLSVEVRPLDIGQVPPVETEQVWPLDTHRVRPLDTH